MDMMKEVKAFLNEALYIYAPSTNEDLMFSFTSEKFKEIGFTQIEPYLTASCPNLLLTKKGSYDAPHYFLNAHLDHASIVMQKEVELNGFGYDCKLGIAMIYALCKHKFKDANIDILFDVQEENGLLGTRIFCSKEKHKMPFYKKRLTNTILAYSFDGAYEYSKGKDILMPAKTAKQYVEALSGNLIIKDNLIIKSTRNRNTIAAQKIMTSLKKNYEDVCVLRYGASVVLLSAILPIVLVMPGMTSCNTKEESVNFNITKSTLSLFD